MKIPEHGAFAEAWEDGLRRLLREGEVVDGVNDRNSVGSAFGNAVRPTRELRPHAFVVTDPLAFLALSHERRINPVYIVGQWLWAMSGDNRADTIGYYNANAARFTDDGEHLESALGIRLRTPVDQIDAALDLLRRDPTTRRAQLILARPRDTRAASRDVSCATSAQIFLRHGRLEMAVTMRSQSALGVLPYDVSFFMLLQIWLAGLLEVPLGRHSWLAWSFHAYDDELDHIERVLASAPLMPVKSPTFTLPRTALDRLLCLEADLRQTIDADARAFVSVTDRLREWTGLEAVMGNVLLYHTATRVGNATAAQRAVDNLPAEWHRALVLSERAPVQ